MKSLSVKTLQFILKQAAKLIIWRFNPKVIAITGSAGKTSAKEAIYAVLSASGGKNHRLVRKSSGNLNNELGIPLTIIKDWSEEELKLVSRGQPAGEKLVQKLFFWIKAVFLGLAYLFILKKNEYPDVLILEYGADHPGDIKYLLEIAKPQIGIITTIGEIPVHVEFFSGPEAVAKEKGKLIESLPTNGFTILNFDNEIVMGLKEKTRARIISFGFSDGADVKISSFENHSALNQQTMHEKYFGVSFKIEYGGSFVPVVLKNTFSRAQAYASAVAACVALTFDLNLVEIAEALLTHYKPAKRRMNLLKGTKGSYIIDDSYNASPISVREALNTLSGLEAKRKIAILGDMLELGEYSGEAHKFVGQMAGGIVDYLITVGPQAKIISESAQTARLGNEKKFHFAAAEQAIPVIKNLIKEGDLVLVKASRGIGLDRIVDEIKANSH
jgi:UDP-N-acetylmuramoyl-tripeptide--D-alanyl-D-alanine ligase